MAAQVSNIACLVSRGEETAQQVKTRINYGHLILRSDLIKPINDNHHRKLLRKMHAILKLIVSIFSFYLQHLRLGLIRLTFPLLFN